MELRPVIATLLQRTLWHLALFAGCGTLYIPLAEGGCVYHFAVFASGSSGVTLQQYDVTFSQYLNEQLSVKLNCTFNVTPIYRVGQYYEQLAQGSVDFALLDATTFACLNVLLADNSDNLVLDVLKNRSDAVLLRSDAINNFQQRGLVNASDFKLIEAGGTDWHAVVQETRSDYPYPSSTALIPDIVVVAAGSVASDTRKAVATALFRINRNMYPAQAASYSTFVPPYSYAAMFSLLQKTGLMSSDGRCHPDDDFYDAITCPPHTAKVAKHDMAAHCQESHVAPCPQGYSCYCHPCQPVSDSSTAAAQIGRSETAAIAISAAVVLAVVVISVYMLRMVRMPAGLHIIPYKDLDLDATSTIIGYSKYCVIYQAYYCGMAVTVKRLVPPANPKSPTIFKRNSFRVSPSASPTTSLEIAAHQGLRQTQSLDVVRPAALTPALLRSSSIGPVSPIVVGRGSSRPLLLSAADWVPSDLQSLEQRQTRNWRLQAQQFWVQAKSAMMCAVGSTYRVISGQYFKTLLLKRRVLPRIAACIKVYHPNIVAIIGVSEYPATKDLLLVSDWLAGGTLKDMVHNVSMQLDLEMILSLLMDVAVAMAYFYHLELPVAHKQLSSEQVLLDSNCKARLHVDYLRDAKADPWETREDRGQVCLPPEAATGKAPGSSSNVYAFGMLMYEVLFRREPYNEEELEENQELELRPKRQNSMRRPKWTQSEADSFPVELIKLMQRCWRTDPHVRPSFEDVKATLSEIANTAFNCSASEASQLSRLKSQALLGQMLPAQVIAALRDGRTPEPEHYASVTVIFCDIVDFADLYELLQPQQVLEMLDRLYNVLDNLALRHQLFKVETIGCTHMAVGNLQPSLRDHVAKACWFAMDAHKAAQTIAVCPDDPSLGCISLKIGMHCGPVVASVVGTANPRYCLFGDTVNTASRMESNSLSNRTQMSKSAAHLAVKQDSRLQFHITPRPGHQQLKGKGPMRTYWLEPEPTFSHWRSSAHRQFGTASFDSNASSDSSMSSKGGDEHTEGQKRRSAEIARRKNAENAERRRAHGSTTSADLTRRNNSADNSQAQSAEFPRIDKPDPVTDSQSLSRRSNSVPDAIAGLFRETARQSLRSNVQRSSLFSLSSMNVREQ